MSGRLFYQGDRLRAASLNKLARTAAGVVMDVGEPGEYVRRSGEWVLASSLPGGTTVITVPEEVHVPALGHEGAFFRTTNDLVCDVTIPANADAAFQIGTRFSYEQAASGRIFFGGADGVTINLLIGLQAVTPQQFAVAHIIKVGDDEWTLFGDLTVVIPE